MKKILISLAVIGAAGAIVAGATGAFFSDTETSTGNTFTAGAIDLGIDNESYLNGVFQPNTSWATTFDLDDLQGNGPDGAYLFFNFADLKPGDHGEDTISLVVRNNPSWVCAEVTVTSDEENDITEPEADLLDSGPAGELAQELNFIWWADDGDNVLETDENVIQVANLGNAPLNFPVAVTLADSQTNIWTGLPNDPFPGSVTDENTRFIGKGFCFGAITQTPVQAGLGDSPAVDAGFTCNGVNVGNISQTDSVTMDISFSAVQSRNNSNFVCSQRAG